MPASTSLFEKLGADILARMFEVAAHGLALVDTQGRFVHLNDVGCSILDRAYDELLGRDLTGSITRSRRDAAAAWLRKSLAGRPQKQDFALSRPDGRERTVSFFCVPVLLEDRAAGLLAFHDVTVARRAEFETKALARITARLARETSVRAISDALAEGIVEVSPAVASAVVLLSTEPVRGRVAGSHGLPEGFSRALEESLLLEPTHLRERMPGPGTVRVLRDLQAIYRSDPVRTLFAPYLDGVRWDTVASVPLVYLGRRTGALFAYYRKGHRPSEPELAFLRTVADQSVFAIENARLQVEAQDLAALEERQRLARELHDSVSQALYGIALGTRSARSLLGRDPDRVAERLDYVMKMAEAAISEMRALIFELRPETLEAEGLVTALAKQASAMQARHGVEVTAELGAEPRLSFGAKQALFRIVQEALHNVVKHARARRVALAVRPEADRVVLEVRDDGIGFDPRGEFPGHLGLRSMRERAEGLGGRFTVVSAVGEGTTLRVELPLEAPDRP